MLAAWLQTPALGNRVVKAAKHQPTTVVTAERAHMAARFLDTLEIDAYT